MFEISNSSIWEKKHLVLYLDTISLLVFMKMQSTY